MFILPILKLGLFCIIDSWPLRHKGTKEIATEKAENTEKQFIGENKGTIVMVAREDRLDGGFGSAKIKVQSGKLRNPDLVGLGVLIVTLFSISRILFLLDVYYTSTTVGCQVKFRTRCSILDARYSMLDTRCRMLDGE